MSIEFPATGAGLQAGNIWMVTRRYGVLAYRMISVEKSDTIPLIHSSHINSTPL